MSSHKVPNTNASRQDYIAVEPPAVEAHVVKAPAIKTPAVEAPVVEARVIDTPAMGPQEEAVEPHEAKGDKRDDYWQAGAWYSLYKAYEAAAALGQRLLDGLRAIFSQPKPVAYRTGNFE